MNTARSLWRRIAWHVFPAMMALFTFVIAKEIDTRFFPVITDFVIFRMDVEGRSAFISGRMDKKRDCRFIEVSAYGDNSGVAYVHFMDKPKGEADYTRPVRRQLYGPWRIDAYRSTTVTIVARHSCHALWDHSTVLTTITIPRTGG